CRQRAALASYRGVCTASVRVCSTRRLACAAIGKARERLRASSPHRRRGAAWPALPSRSGRRPNQLRSALVGVTSSRKPWLAGQNCRDSAKKAPKSTRLAGVAGRYSVNNSERTIIAAYCARLTATLSRFLLSRKEIPRGTSSTDDADIEMKTTG